MRAIELFAGAGGLGMGVSRAGFVPAAVVEWDKWCCDTIRENRLRHVQPLAKWPSPIEGDIRDVDFTKHEGLIDLVTGGPPCQPFSLGGKHRGYDDVRDMWPQAVRVVRETKPKAFIFENVKGLTRATFASYLAYIVQQLTYPELTLRADEDWPDHLRRLEKHHTRQPHKKSGLTYNVVYRVLNAANYGVPQKRERVVFVGFRNDLGIEWSFPEQTHSLDVLLGQQASGEYWERHSVPKAHRVTPSRLATRAQSTLISDKNRPWRTVRDAIGDLPDPEREQRKSSLLLNHKFQSGARSYAGHTGSPLDLPAKTLKAGVHGVPGGENMLVRPDGTVRYFTVRESARLQTFPDEFAFHGAWSEAMRQLGNAVPVELATVIAKDVRIHLNAATKAKAT
ncbi:MAG: DNA cytosine methyltransferase [Afipia sp.]|nr:DNA cytosine methyltransferase [Afipia sp.]